MSGMIEASCHCGAVKLQIAEKPERLTSCNCSICHHLGTLWAYYHPSQVALVSGKGATVPYIQGERTLAIHHCPTCGCVTHWESSREEHKDRMAVNARLMKRDEIADVLVRRFDGPDTWTYLD
jgi:hypothetical protein